MVQLGATTIIPPACKAFRKDSKVEAKHMTLNPTEEKELLRACESVAPTLTLSPWEMFFLTIATLYGTKVVQHI